jgi:hypothetical protein
MNKDLKFNMISGKKYKVILDIIEIEGYFISKFVKYERESPNESDGFDKAIFENAEIEPDWGFWTVEEILE